MIRLRSEMIAYETETQTDRQGRFVFDGLPLTSFHLTIEFPGYRPYSSIIDISISKMSYEDIALRRDSSKDTREVPPEGPQAVLDARVAQIPPEAKNEFQQAQKRSADNDLVGAAAHYKRAIELFANYAEAFQLLGGVYLQQGNLALAEQAFARAVAIENRLANAQLALGLTRNLMGRVREAEPPLQKAVELDPKNPEAHFELAKNQFALQKFSDAQGHAEKALQLKPENPPVYVVLGYALLRQKKAVEAERAFQHFLRIAPASPMAGDVRQVEAMIEQHEKQMHK